jgi:rhodanese-related sulfurtransferase
MTDGKTFRQRVHEARSAVRMITPDQAKELLDRGGVTLIDVGEEWQLRERGTIAGARNVTRGELEIKADAEEERRDPSLQDRRQKIILTCGGGGKATLSASALQEMGFTDVSVIQGGCRGWLKPATRLSLTPPRSAARLRRVRTNRAGSATRRRARLSGPDCPS